ncbi:putative dsRNA-binding protein [Amycolatopsis sp. NPDC101161]|uniref:putative dsRNA-binding protein n=1 Tax=Amycolatopsis sp. NPDC101161 TaxID=3363940 RepID=UPI00382BDAB9
MAELIDPLEFGVLQGHPNLISYDAPVVRALEGVGLDGLDEKFRRALWVALVDPTYLYENQSVLPDLTKWHLEALSRLGATYLRRIAMIEAYQDPAATAASMSIHVSRCADGFAAWAAKRTWLASSATVGRTFATAATLPRKVIADLGKRLIGFLCLAGKEGVAARLVADLTSLTNAATTVVDPKTTLARELAPDVPSYEIIREGPDHEPVFHTTVVDARGRCGEGTGTNKKVSSNAAAQDFLQRHCPPPKLSSPARTAPTSPPVPIPRPLSHVRAVGQLRELFSLPQKAEAVLSQALIHSSWAYENKPLVASCGQQDNSALGFVGSETLGYEHALAVTRKIVNTRPDEFMFLSVQNEVYERAFRQSDLVSGLLLGKGQEQLGTTTEIGATAFQALIGAVAVAKGFPSSLEKVWPPQWHSIWSAIASDRTRAADPTTQLSMVAAIVPFEVGYEVERSGPDHASDFEAVASIQSPALNISTTVREGTGSNKARAKHRVSVKILAVLDKLSDGHGMRSLLEPNAEDVRALARFLLAALVAAVPTASNHLKKWSIADLCGLHLAGDPLRLAEWAREADRLLGDRLGRRVVPLDRLANAFRAMSGIDDFDAVDRELSTMLGAIERIDDPQKLTQDYVDHVVQLCDVYRCIGSDEPEGDISTLEEEWRIRYRNRLVIKGDLPSITLSGHERAALAAVAAALLASQPAGTVEVLPGAAVQLAFRTEGVSDRSRFELVSLLWNTTVHTLRMTGRDKGIDVSFTRSGSVAASGAISRAAKEAMTPKADQYRSSLADLLHDLKNQLVAARVATAGASEGETLTVELRRKLTASTHLDEARAIALRLKATTSVLGSTTSGNIDLGMFLRDYASRVLSRLPHSISLSIPAAERSVQVEIGAPALLAVLDNLVTNAVEAMSEGGSISIEWTADIYEAAVEIADNGPGLPDEVALAWAHRKRIHSTKVGGNGLGLWGAQALVSRAGGGLALQPTDRGTSWLLTLPLATDAGVE